jgi:hypothetical protein
MLKLLRFSLLICGVLTIALFGARIVGKSQPIPRSIQQLHLLDCAPPCWIGITPGETTVESAKAKMLAAFSGQNDLQIRDTAGSPFGYIAENVIENAIEGEHFFVSVRLTTSAVLDGKTETILSIHLVQSRDDRSGYAPTVADILGTFGPPHGIIIEHAMSIGSEITLKYAGWDAVFYTRSHHVEFTEYPRIYLVNQGLQIPTTGYLPWKGFSTLTLGK